MRRYTVRLPLVVHTGDGHYGQGDEFEKDFTEEEEAENVRSGLLAIVPVRYRVIGGSVVHDTAPGDEFELGLPMGNEAQLIAGGHIERVEQPPEPEEPVEEPAEKPSRKRKGK